MRVLLVEDDPKLGDLLARVLSSHGYTVTLARNAAEARAAQTTQLELVIVDWMLPDGDGLDVAVRLRRAGFEGPMLMLTARDQTKDRVQALDLGVDDYLSKPFAVSELLARLRALLRRPPRLGAMDAGPLHFDLLRRHVFADGRLLEVTTREFDLLLYLVRRSGETVSKVELIENVWDSDEIVPNVVEVHVSRLRDKLGKNASLVETVRGAGYRVRTEVKQ